MRGARASDNGSGPKGSSGFPLALVFAWALELTPEGIRRTHEVAHHESITTCSIARSLIAN